MKGDFLGFSFDGIHCSQLGITHVSSSDRYSEELFPEVKDKTIEIPNNHGEYYYGSVYGTRSFTIDFAYDSISELQFRKIRHLFGTRKICELIFDERPYKVYYAKIESPLEMSYICFDEPKRVPAAAHNGVRIVDRTSHLAPTITQISEGLDISINSRLFLSYFDTEGDHVFIYHDQKWFYIEDSQEIELPLEYYGITINSSSEIDGIGFTITNETVTDVTWEQVTPWEYVTDSQGEVIRSRTYKGEGTINLICYQPFAHQLFKIRELYEQSGEGQGSLFTTYDNVDEWIESSGILTEDEWNNYHIDQIVEPPITTITKVINIPPSQSYTYELLGTPIGEISVSGTSSYTIENNSIVFNNITDTTITATITYNCRPDSYTCAIPVYNPGDLDVGFCLYIPFVNGKILSKDENSDIIINGDTEVLVLKNEIEQKGNDTGIVINTRTHLIEGVIFSQIANVNDYRRPSWKTTGNLYNECIKKGEFPYIKRNDWALDEVMNRPQAIYISCADGNKDISIYYDYLYF